MKQYVYIYNSANRGMQVHVYSSEDNHRKGAKTFSGLVNNLVREHAKTPNFNRFRTIHVSYLVVQLIYKNTLQSLKTFLKNETTDIKKLNDLLVNLECIFPPNNEIFLSPDIIQQMINSVTHDPYVSFYNTYNTDLILQKGSYDEIKYSLSLLFNKVVSISVSHSAYCVIKKSRSSNKSISRHRRG